MSKSERKAKPELPVGAASDPESGVPAAMRGSKQAKDQSEAEAGALLRQLRQSAGADPALLASALKVAPQKIQALEEGRWGDLPNLTFARSLAAAVCRAIGADPTPVLARMPAVAVLLESELGVRREPFKPSTFSTGGGLDSLRGLPGAPRWLVIVVAVLLIGMLVVWLLPKQQRLYDDAVDPRTAASAEQATSAASAAVDMVSEPIAVSPSAGASMADGASQFAPVVAGGAAAPAASIASAAAAASASAAIQRGSGIVERNAVVVSATGRTWVGVRDGNGVSVLDRVLVAGDELNVNGAPPLTVIVGDKNVVSVTVRGKRLDLNGYTHGGVVARFTVDPVEKIND